MNYDLDKKYIVKQLCSYIENNKEYFYYVTGVPYYFDLEEDCIKYMSYVYPNMIHNKDYIIDSLLRNKKNDYLWDSGIPFDQIKELENKNDEY